MQSNNSRQNLPINSMLFYDKRESPCPSAFIYRLREPSLVSLRASLDPSLTALPRFSAIILTTTPTVVEENEEEEELVAVKESRRKKFSARIRRLLCLGCKPEHKKERQMKEREEVRLWQPAQPGISTTCSAGTPNFSS
ncbi:hypothetical protein ACJQWK_03158 [Exserohilum turcicum]|uniref:Uncharacterized protein n=1 Tax=Exserohilum turcicum (strain 28A) TaxID=671987 RepID=R0J6C7_EXST2|nr:uncharacterized protein SETTUDRAFT_30712 [Exserohilum turcica Et28A]EOA92246.1 hypothetical protein SETTUDRAFT_30712 [Exserohilum turcica Et28A]